MEGIFPNCTRLRDGTVLRPHENLSNRREKALQKSEDVQLPSDGCTAYGRGRRARSSRKTAGIKCFHHRKGCSWTTQLLLSVIIMGSLPGISPSQISNSVCKFFYYKEQCEKDLDLSKKKYNITKETHCLGEFDRYICWPHTEAGKMKLVQCPDYLVPNTGNNSAFRFCGSNASWHQDSTIPHTDWRNSDECDVVHENATASDESQFTMMANLRIMYTIGNGISLTCLVIALLLLSFFKKLHCTRNYIHMNLMVSFILKNVIILLKDHVTDSYFDLGGSLGDGMLSDLETLRQHCDDDPSTGWVLTRCRLVITLMHYTVTANYFWLLVEGMYLQMLLIFVMYENRYFAGFMVFGWGAPWISVLIWVALRINFENEGCWETNNDLHIWWTIRAPIMASILLNFIMFVNIVRMIVSKLRANHMARTDRKLRLAKSTLSLIPLLGIHYVIFMAVTEEYVSDNDTAMHLKLSFELFFASIQGALISILYCFLNNEVRAEVRRAWKLWRSHRDLPRRGSTFRKSSTIGSTNQSTQVTVMYTRNSAVASETPLLEQSHQSRDSNCSDSDSKDGPSNRTKSNGNCILKENNEMKLYSKSNGVSFEESKLPKDHIDGVAIDFTSDDLFLSTQP